MNKILFFILIIGVTTTVFGQSEFNTKFKGIKPLKGIVKPKKEALPPAELSKLNLPKIVTPNIFKETNIFGNRPKPNNSFQIGTAENHFSMTSNNKFSQKLGDIYQDKMTKDLDKTMVREELKEDNSLLDRADRFLGDFRTRSKFLEVKYRDYIQIDGDLINVYLNDKLIQSQLYLNYEFGVFKIPLAMGINKVEFVVASQGTSGGNTAEIHVVDDASKSVTDEYWNNLALGTRIKLIVIKE